MLFRSTPLLMKTLAGTLIEIKFVDMMMEIIKIVLVPIGAALLHDYLKRAGNTQRRKVDLLVLFSAAWILLVIFYLLKTVSQPEWRQSITLSAFFAGAAIAGWLYHQLYTRFPKLDKIMPLISMFGIIYFTTVTTAAGRENLMKVGVLLFIASVIHNAAGYFFGYWLSRLFGMDKMPVAPLRLKWVYKTGAWPVELPAVWANWERWVYRRLYSVPG